MAVNFLLLIFVLVVQTFAPLVMCLCSLGANH